jgi:hypothetical protein
MACCGQKTGGILAFIRRMSMRTKMNFLKGNFPLILKRIHHFHPHPVFQDLFLKKWMFFPLASVAGIQQNLLAGPANGNRSGTVRAIIVTKYFFEISQPNAERVFRRCFLKEN